jgi:hypothetical protein
VAKRSPILGYNHNVRYRGLVFHVQTEDSGVLSPHLFTHLFHTGVIVSTRKLVYDSGSGEDAIKSLMQAQHKAVLKDLRRGTFDDKIDEYLGSTPGLLPRGARPGAPEIEIEPTSEPVQPDDSVRRDATIPDVRPSLTGRAQTAERNSPPTQVHPTDDIDIPNGTELPGAVAAISAANNATIRTPIPRGFTDTLQAPSVGEDSQPEIEIQLELDEPEELSGRTRSNRDTDMAMPPNSYPLDDHTRPTIDVSAFSDGVPAMGNVRQPGESMPPPPPPAEVRRTPSAGVGAATLPPARPIARPPSRQSITPPQVVSRPLTSDPDRSDAVEVYAPAPPSADPPPGIRARAPQPEDDRPGQYAKHSKRPSQPIPKPPATRDRSAGIPIPPGLGRPGRIATQNPSPRPASSAVPQATRPAEPAPTGPRPRTPTPTRASGPTTARTNSPNSGVVMTRPAVIVGAPAKQSPPRVRKAREEEGRGFGQGLISEKSLDEVILAYLSEDADDK